MLPSTAEVAFGGVIIYQRQRQLSLIQLLNAASKNSRSFLCSKRGQQGPRKVLEGGGWLVVVWSLSALSSRRHFEEV